MTGTLEQFIIRQEPMYERLQEDREREKTGTAEKFFELGKAMQGPADDVNREGAGDPEHFMHNPGNSFGRDVDDPNRLEGETVRHFVNEKAVMSEVSNINKSQYDAGEVYQHRGDAFVGTDINDYRSRDATEQNFLHREEALFADDVPGDLDNRNQTQIFFKNDEGVRGDVSEMDRAAATQLNYFANVERPELGRADGFSRMKSDLPQVYMDKSRMQQRLGLNSSADAEDRQRDLEFINKSILEGAAGRVASEDANEHELNYMSKSVMADQRAGGTASPLPTRSANMEQIDKSGAEFGQAESFLRRRSDATQEYMDKSGVARSRPAGSVASDEG